VSNGDINVIGVAVTTLAAGAFLLLECFGIRLPPRVQWMLGISLLVVLLWFLSRFADYVSV
jgi:lipopolysaccharide export LptBFGC system permease protein LptF